MVDDLVRLVKLGIITLESIQDSAVRAEVETKLASQ